MRYVRDPETGRLEFPTVARARRDGLLPGWTREPAPDVIVDADGFVVGPSAHMTDDELDGYAQPVRSPVLAGGHLPVVGPSHINPRSKR